MFVGDSWFSSIKTVIELALQGLNYVGQVKQCHKDLPKKYLEGMMERIAPRNWIVMPSVKPMIPLKSETGCSCKHTGNWVQVQLKECTYLHHESKPRFCHASPTFQSQILVTRGREGCEDHRAAIYPYQILHKNWDR